jgi:hypothetical protein
MHGVVPSSSSSASLLLNLMAPVLAVTSWASKICVCFLKSDEEDDGENFIAEDFVEKVLNEH